MTDRFDFEQKIMQAWGVCEDLDLLLAKLCEDVDFVDVKQQDEITNIVLGMKAISQMRFESLFKDFETLVTQRKFT